MDRYKGTGAEDDGGVLEVGDLVQRYGEETLGRVVNLFANGDREYVEVLWEGGKVGFSENEGYKLVAGLKVDLDR